MLSIALGCAFCAQAWTASSYSRQSVKTTTTSAKNTKLGQAPRAVTASRAPASAPVNRTTTNPSRSPAGVFAGAKEASGGSAGDEKVVKVKGQSRNLSMMLVLKGEKDKIKFGEIRENYKQEVIKTNY